MKMAVFHNRSKIADGVYLTQICDPKYKTNVVRVRFIVPIDADKLGVNALLTSLLVTSNAKVPSRSELSKRFLGLYGTSVGAVWGNVTDYQSLGLTISVIMDKYTIGGETISEEAVQMLLDCIFYPDIKDGKFNEKYFRLRKQELLDNIDAAINDKRSYGFMKAKEVIFEGESSALSELGSRERAEKITQEEVLSRYKYLMEEAFIDITICGGGEADEAVKLLKDAFGKVPRNADRVEYIKHSPVKAQVRECEEPMDIQQSKMYMAYKTACRDIYTCKVFTTLLGGSAFSKLFLNVREKLSLCYGCDSYYSELKGVMLIESGVDAVNIEKAQEAIREQVKILQSGGFTEEELENTKMYIKSNFMANYDSEWDIAAWYSVQNMRGTCYTPEEVEKIIQAITT